MAIDLSGLDLDMGPEETGPAAPSGKPLALAIADVIEDENQPRKEFRQEEMDEMIASVKARGVKTPISVKPHPTLPGKYLLNFGARRFRASVALGLATIPAIIDEDHNDYDQVIENLQRADLTPLEMAIFIKRKVEDGEKPAAIATKLGKGRSYVTEHLAMIDAPAPVMDLYMTGRLGSARTFYDLRSLYDKAPEAVTAFLDTHTGDVDRRAVASLSESIKGGGKPKPAPATAPVVRHDEQPDQTSGTASSAPTVRHDEQTPSTNAGSSTAPAVRHDEQKPGAEAGREAADAGASKASGKTDPGASETPKVEKLLAHNPANEKALGKPATKDDPARLKKPVMIVEHDGRAAMVMIYTRPSTPGLLWIKYEDNSEEVEVACGEVRINNLQDATA